MDLNPITMPAAKFSLIRVFTFLTFVSVSWTSFPAVSVANPVWNETSSSQDPDADWIQLTSGEWLKGEIVVMYELKMEFDSDGLGTLFIDWKDIAEIRSKDAIDVNVGNAEIVTGPIRMKDEQVQVEAGGRVREFPREKVVSLAEKHQTEWDLWDVKITAGANFQTGNTDEASYHMKANARRTTARTRLKFDYLGQYSENQNVESANSHSAGLLFDLFMSRRLFFRTFEFRYFRDPFQNINHQLTYAASLGYTFLDQPDLELAGTIGPGIQGVQFESVAPGTNRENVSPALAFGFYYRQDLTSWMEWESDYQASWVEQASGAYNHIFSNGLSFDLYDPITFDLTLIWDYVYSPTARADGTIPDRNDFQLLFGLGAEF